MRLTCNPAAADRGTVQSGQKEAHMGFEQPVK
jgi:hypothetical protein